MLREEYDINPYLQQEVLSASPVRLRWMLISQAVELCRVVEGFWKNGEHAPGDQWLLRVRDILGELLAGVTCGNPVSRQVSDFYLFLLKLVSDVEQSRDVEKLTTLKELLVLEAETWQLVYQKTIADSNPAAITPNGSGATAPLIPSFGNYDESASGSSFSLDV